MCWKAWGQKGTHVSVMKVAGHHDGGMGSELGMDHQHQQRNSTYEVDGFLLSKGEQDQKTR